MILLDTHTLLWFLGDDEKLPSGIRELIENDTDVFVSIASFWEIAIKNSIGKLPLYCTVTEMMDACFQRGIRLLQIKAEHLYSSPALCPSVSLIILRSLISHTAKANGR